MIWIFMWNEEPDIKSKQKRYRDIPIHHIQPEVISSALCSHNEVKNVYEILMRIIGIPLEFHKIFWNILCY